MIVDFAAGLAADFVADRLGGEGRFRNCRRVEIKSKSVGTCRKIFDAGWVAALKELNLKQTMCVGSNGDRLPTDRGWRRFSRKRVCSD